MSFSAKPGALEPGDGEFILAVSHVLSTKDSQLQHLLWRQLRTELRMEVFANWLGEEVGITLLHEIVDGDSVLGHLCKNSSLQVMRSVPPRGRDCGET